MFKKKKTNSVVVTTKEQLKNAINKKEPYIEIKGELAKQLRWIEKLSDAEIKKLSVLLGTLTLGVASFTNPISMVAVAPVAAITGSQIAAIIISSGLTIAVILSILKGYEVEIQYNGDSLRLKRKE